MEDRRDDRHFAERSSRRPSRSPEGLVLRERDDARPRRDRGGGGGGRVGDRSRSRSAMRRSGGERDFRRGRSPSLRKARPRSRSRRRAPVWEGDERGERRDRPPPRARSRSSSSSGGQPARSTAVVPKQKRSGFDQKEMLPENFAMQQLTAMLPKGQPMPEFNPRRIWDTLPNTVTHMNPEVETFLAHNHVEPHAATRLRALPPEFQQVVLSRGSLFGGRDPTAVLLGRIRDACRGVTNPYQFLGRPGQSFSGAPAHGAFSGTTANLNPQTQPSSSDGAMSTAPPADSSGHGSGAEGSRAGEANYGAGGASAAPHEGNSGDWSSWKNDSYANDNTSWGNSNTWDNSRSWDSSKPLDSSRSKFEYRSEKYQADLDRQRGQRDRRENELERKREKVREAAAEMNESRAQEVVSSTAAAKSMSTSKTSKKNSAGEAMAQAANEQENEAERQKREEMQSSIAATIASLSTKVLGKDKAKLAGLVKESGKKGEEQGSDEDMDIDEAARGGNGAFSVPGSQTRLPARAASFNPFRSKPHAAPVSISPPRDPPMAMDLPLLRLPRLEPSPTESAPAPTTSSIPLIDIAKPSRSGPNRAEELLALAEKPADADAYAERAAPSADQKETPNIPAGLRALAQHGSASAGSKHPGMMTGDGSEPMTVPSTLGEAAAMQHNQQLALPSTPATGTSPAPGLAPAVQLPKAAAPQPTSPEEQKKRMEAAARKAHALATLIYYGLQDPNDEADLAKAVHAMATATGDQAAAVAMWQQVAGVEPAQPVAAPQPEEKPPDSVTDLQTLTEQQQNEIQQAAAAAQYSQLWLQQQFHSQLALFENQRLMATGDLPTVTVDGELPRLGQKGKDRPLGISKRTASQPMLPGDWTCPGCGDHQFARNRVCRFCGAAKPLHSKAL